jgi:sirohydrochlorin cobaltochelatase
MSSTRSPTPPGPATEAGAHSADRARWRGAVLVLVAHGSPSCQAHAILARHAAVLKERRLFADVRTMLLHGNPPHAVLADLRDRLVYVVPALMCAGRHTLQELPRVLGLRGEIEGAALPTLHICRPLGLHPALVRLVAARACEALARNRWASGQASVLLVAHGSRTSVASRRAAALQTARLRSQGLFQAVSTAFLEDLPDALASMPGSLVVVGLFASPGIHEPIGMSRGCSPTRGAPTWTISARSVPTPTYPTYCRNPRCNISGALPTAA